MVEHKYTVAEIDALRIAVRLRVLWGSTVHQPNVFGRVYKEVELIETIESHVRTHMLAGHVANDLYEADKVKS